MIALAAVCGILLLILVMPVGIRAVFDKDLTVWLTVLGIRIQIFPGKGKPKKPKKPKKPSSAPTQKKKALIPQGDLAAYLRLFTKLLGKLHRKLRIRQLTLHAVFGGSSPELNYGKAWAVIGCLMPLIEENFRIDRRDVGAFLSEEETKLRILAKAHTVLPLAGLLHIALHALRGYLKIQNNLKKGGKTV